MWEKVPTMDDKLVVFLHKTHRDLESRPISTDIQEDSIRRILAKLLQNYEEENPTPGQARRYTCWRWSLALRWIKPHRNTDIQPSASMVWAATARRHFYVHVWPPVVTTSSTSHASSNEKEYEINLGFQGWFAQLWIAQKDIKMLKKFYLIYKLNIGKYFFSSKFHH